MDKYEFDKMQIPLCSWGYTLLCKDWFGDYRGLRFYALASVGAFFYFQYHFVRKRNYYGRENY